MTHTANIFRPFFTYAWFSYSIRQAKGLRNPVRDAREGRHEHMRWWYQIIELFCLRNSLVVGMQPQVCGKVGSLVGWFLGGPWSAFPMNVEFYRKASCRGRNKNAVENARKIPLLKRHDESVQISIVWRWIFIYQREMAGFFVVDFLSKRIVSANLV